MSTDDKHYHHCANRCYAVTEEERCVDCPTRLPQAFPSSVAPSKPESVDITELVLELQTWAQNESRRPDGQGNFYLVDLLKKTAAALVTPSTTPASSERDIHAKAMYDLARECGWHSFSSRPPVCFIKDKFASSTTPSQEDINEHGVNFDCLAGKLTTLDQLFGYISLLELRIQESQSRDVTAEENRRFGYGTFSKQFHIEYAKRHSAKDDNYPYSLRDGDIVDSKNRRVSISGNSGIRDLLNERSELRAALAQYSKLAERIKTIVQECEGLKEKL